MSLKSCQRGQIENREKLSKINDLNAQLMTKQITPMQFLEFATNLVVGDEVVPGRNSENEVGRSKEGNEETGHSDGEEEEEFRGSSDDDIVIAEEIQEDVISVKKWIITEIEIAISTYEKNGKEGGIEKKTKNEEQLFGNDSVDETSNEVIEMEKEIMPIDVAFIELDHCYYLSKEKEECLIKLNNSKIIEKGRMKENTGVQEVKKKKPTFKKCLKKKVTTLKTESLKLNLIKNFSGKKIEWKIIK